MLSEPKEDTNWILSMIRQFIEKSHENKLRSEGNEKAWIEFLVGFSNGSDPLYQFYKKDIGDFYLSPSDFFAHTYPKTKFKGKDLTVITWILLQTEKTKSDHRLQNQIPTERWVRARIFGEQVNDKLREYVITNLRKAGFEAVAPVLSPLFNIQKFGNYGWSSTWSERHAAYAAGLGTFGLCDGLITPKGKAMRCGSVIAKINIPPSKRPYKDHHAYCLFYAKGTCGECIKRCPVGAISEQGHDKEKCKKYLDFTAKYVPTHYGFEGYGCGFCQTGVPCESEIPE
jgi:hypothetical protein